jgi:hypothetical protein
MFSDENDFKEIDFFFFFFFFFFFCVFGRIPENILQYCAKDRAEWAWVRRAFLENGL